MNAEVLKDNAYKMFEEAELFTRRFGSFNKQDFEVMLFTIYMDSYDGEPRDYDISVALGITESRARNLRVKLQLMYPRSINEIDALTTAINGGHYHSDTRDVTITIENPSVRNSIKNKLELENFNVGLTLNNKQLVLPIESIVIIAAILDIDSDKVFANLKEELKKENIDISKIEGKKFKEKFFDSIDTADKLVSILSNIKSSYFNASAIIVALSNIVCNG